MKTGITAVRNLFVVSLALGACTGATASPSGSPFDTPSATSASPGDPLATAETSVPGTIVRTSLPPEQEKERAAIQAKLDAFKGLDAAAFASSVALPFKSDLGYDPLEAKALPAIQSSRLALDDDEKAALGARGFVITEKKRFPSFVYGYQSIYSQDLPVYVSADSILYAVHESFDRILKVLEERSLAPALDRLLGSMAMAIGKGAGADISTVAHRDADLYLSVARSLLKGSFVAPTAGGDANAAKELFERALAASGFAEVMLFGVQRIVDFSQFTPRGHYTESVPLERYFRATMWLGRVDLRLLETQPNHTQLFHRRQLEGAFVLRAAMSDAAHADWRKIVTAIDAFVGEPDNMTLPELDALLADLEIASAADLAKKTDGAIAQAIVNGGYGTQRISSHIMINGLGSGTMPLSSTFLLLGQRYVLDSHVFSNVVYDRVQGGTVMRMLPNPLDVGFAALGNDHAGRLLGPELAKYSYAPDLASMQLLADAHPRSFWDANLYNGWLGALRALSPKREELANPSAAGLPAVAATEPWGRRILSTQLASWAELRHDTILYVKQSYTTGATCEYPDAYVDPYPELFAKIGAFAAIGTTVVGALGLGSDVWATTITRYFAELQAVSAILETMAKNQRSGAPHSAEHLAFINRLAFVNGCGSLDDFDGWYARLFFDRRAAIALDPVVADVHTQPTDELGNMVGNVLHVGTGLPRAMVVTVDSCAGPRAYFGLVSSYFEKVTSDFKRLDDATWKGMVFPSTPPDVPWMTSVVVR